ncbi:zinc-binding dehydrogenase [Clostridium sp. Marseille-P3244]|uniref:zinc-binding dehydrogenase n=1 Tax=Clostridium sp. Marseille-P3244 TaxID=1871020 RepID=UPI000A610A2A|nr:zinc-binding dehydrogenase [Clostridium sp. Marseille-P3244]
MQTMRAVMYYGPGILKVEEVPRPKAGPGEIIIKNISATTCGTDLKRYKRGYRRDRAGEAEIFGHEAAGVVYEVGEGVTRFKPGDSVVTHNTAPCNECYWCKQGQPSLCDDLVRASGAWAQYRRIPAPIVKQNSFIIPPDISYRLAAIVEPLACAVYNIEESGLKLMDVVAINGAGPLGLMQVKTAKLRGAYVIVCDSIPFRLECARKLGADVCINIDEIDDQVQAVRGVTPYGRGADIVIDCTGIPRVWEMNMNMARKGGTVMQFGGCKGGSTVTFDCDRLHYSQLTVKGIFHTVPRAVSEAFDMICRGEIPEEIFISESFSLEQAEEALISHAGGQVVKNEIRCDA